MPTTITVKVVDKNDLIVPQSDNSIEFSIEGPGEIIATDNGDPTNLVPFPSHKRKAFNGLVLVIVRSKTSDLGVIKLTAKSQGLNEALMKVQSK